MTADERLATIHGELQSAGIDSLVMGGHAVRFYGLIRNTVDFDLFVSPETWNDLALRVNELPSLRNTAVSEGNSWRPRAFRRFQIGRLPDGREEWLEFWCGNHLLPPFGDLRARSQRGTYGRGLVTFLSLSDLIRSKETERLRDWQDINYLEEFLDASALSRLRRGEMSRPEALIGLRTRTGLEAAMQMDLFFDRDEMREIIQLATHPVTCSLLLPFAPMAELGVDMFEPVVVSRLRSVIPASPMHLSLVEIIRRRYRAARQAEDKADKERIRSELNRPA